MYDVIIINKCDCNVHIDTVMIHLPCYGPCAILVKPGGNPGSMPTGPRWQRDRGHSTAVASLVAMAAARHSAPATHGVWLSPATTSDR